jgi:parallel beta-helix repeat protein
MNMKGKALLALAVGGAAGAVAVVPAAGAGGACTQGRPCTMAAAIASTPPGGTAYVKAGTYAGGFTIAKKLHLVAAGRVVLDASTSPTGVGLDVVGPGGSGSVIDGFIVEKAQQEGILVGNNPGDPTTKPAPVSGVVVENNIVEENDKGRTNPTASGECKATPPAPVDCGGGIHLIWASNTTVVHNVVAYNSDGILLTDEFGPTSHNTVSQNRVLNNLWECGIVLAGHSPKGTDQTGKLTPELGGVFANTIENNVVRNNGVTISGAGVLIGGGAPGSAVYNNVIRGNTIDISGHAGVTIHQHVAGYLGGNVIENNTIGKGNLIGDDDFAAAVDPKTTGILVASGAPPGAKLPPFLLPSPITGTVIRGNKISDDAVGVWALNAPGDFTGNTFGAGVTTPVEAH